MATSDQGETGAADGSPASPFLRDIGLDSALPVGALVAIALVGLIAALIKRRGGRTAEEPLAPAAQPIANGVALSPAVPRDRRVDDDAASQNAVLARLAAADPDLAPTSAEVLSHATAVPIAADYSAPESIDYFTEALRPDDEHRSLVSPG